MSERSGDTKKSGPPAINASGPIGDSTDDAAGEPAEIRIIVNVRGESTEYHVARSGGGSSSRGWNVSLAHDPAGRPILDKPAASADEAIARFSARFDKDAVDVRGADSCFAVVQGGDRVVAVEKRRFDAEREADRLNSTDESGNAAVHPATAAVAEMFRSAGSQGVHIIVTRGGLVSLAS